MHYSLTKKRTTLAWMGVCTAAILAGLWGWHDAKITRQELVAGDSRRCALAFQPVELARLTENPADNRSPAYAQIKKRLEALNDSHARVQRMYLIRLDPATGLFHSLVSTEPDGAEVTRTGDIMPPLLSPADVQKTLRDGEVTFCNDYTDFAGRWTSSFVRIAEDDRHDLLRMDADYLLVRDMRFSAACSRALYVFLLLGLPLALHLILRRYSRQSLFIQKLTAAVEQSATPMMIIDADNTIEYVNSGLCMLSKYARDELVGQRWIGTARAQPAETVAKVENLSHEGKTWTEDLELERKGGERYPANVTSTPIRNHNGQILAFIIVITDMTEIQRQAHEMRVAKENAETADKTKGVFLTTMSHEVRTPLNGIIGFTDLLLDTELTAEQREYVLAIHTSGEALMRLSEDILDHSRIESGRMHLAPEPCDVRSIIEDALDIVAPRAAGKKLQLLHSVDPAVPAQVMADPGRLRQVIVNLVGNAIKFTPAGEVEVSLRPVPAGTGSSTPPFAPPSGSVAPFPPARDNQIKLEFTIRDTGIGIASEDQSRLFRPFVQLDSSNARRYGGAGLGLVISYDLVRLMGGNTSVSSELGQGALFTFTIRCGRIQNSDTAWGANRAASRLSGKRIAIVAAHPGLRREIERELVVYGADVRSVELDKLDTAGWDFTVLDCNEGTLSYLREYMQVPEKWHAGKVVGLVGIELEPHERQTLRPYFRALVGKPLHHAILIDRLTRHPGEIDASVDSAEL